MTQEFSPLQSICGHLNAFHVYTSDLTRIVEANHYCGHLTEDVRQCLLYDSPSPGARLIGVEYMIKSHLYDALPQRWTRRSRRSHSEHAGTSILLTQYQQPFPAPAKPGIPWNSPLLPTEHELLWLKPELVPFFFNFWRPHTVYAFYLAGLTRNGI